MHWLITPEGTRLGLSTGDELPHDGAVCTTGATITANRQPFNLCRRLFLLGVAESADGRELEEPLGVALGIANQFMNLRQAGSGDGDRQ